jgi:hypothetical protein
MAYPAPAMDRPKGSDTAAAAEIGGKGLQGAVLFGALAPDDADTRQRADSGLLWDTLGSYDIQNLIETAAIRNDIPVWFLARLIRQESGFNPQAVSPVGALGIAQFMPVTAAERGLANPFDPAQAIPKSAELLKDLKGRFGNLGLAAAAYNAGPQRVQSWLAGRGDLPTETRSYVLAITGRPVQEWALRDAAAASGDALRLPGVKATLLASNAPPLPSGEVSKSSLFSMEPMTRATSATHLAATQDRRLSLLLQAEAQQRHVSRKQRQVKAGGEQSLCSLMNSMGSTCIVQKIY